MAEEEKKEEQQSPIEEAKKRLSIRSLMAFDEPEDVGSPKTPDLTEDDSPKEKQKEESGGEQKPKEEPKDKPENKPESKKKEEGDTYEFKGTQVRAKAKDKPAPTKEPELTKKDIEEIVQKANQPKVEKPSNDGLPEHIREEIATWEYGESKGLAEKGTADKLRRNFRERTALIEKLQQENADDETYDVTRDPQYKRWAKNNELKLSESAKKKIERAQLKEEIANELKSEKSKPEQDKIQKLERELKEMREKPEIQKASEQYKTDLADSLKSEETRKAIEDKWGTDAFFEAFNPEIEKTITQSNRIATEFLSLRKGLKQFDPSNKIHKFIGDFVDHEARKVAGSPTAKIRNGQEFIHPYDPEFDRKNGWTFSTEDILNLLKKKTQRDIAKKIQTEDERLEGIFAKRKGTPSEKAKGSDSEDDTGKDTSTKSRPAGTVDKQGGKPKGIMAGYFGM